MSSLRDDGPSEIQASHASRNQYFQSCLDLEGYPCSQIEDTSTDDETIVDEIIDLEDLRHSVDGGKRPPFNSLEEDVFHEGTDHSLQNCLLPLFPRKESDSIV